MSKKQNAHLGRRELLRTGGLLSAVSFSKLSAHVLSSPGSPAAENVYTQIGVRPFINCTATLTINGGSAMFPEVIAAIAEASRYHVNLDKLMEAVSPRLAQLLDVECGIVTAGTAAALTHATSACLVGTDPEKIQRLPNLDGLKDEVIIPVESRNVYDHAVRTLGVRIVEVNSPAELKAAIGPKTAMIYVLGNHFGKAKFDLKDIAPIARPAGVPILIDAAADYLIVPNPYIALGADMVAYSGGKIMRGPQNAGLLIGRRDLVRAAWANSAPHHSFGRALKVSKESIVGMLKTVEIWRSQRDIKEDFAVWESWYAVITDQVTRVPGVTTKVQGPIRGGPFPTLQVTWDKTRISLTAGQLGKQMLAGEPSIMTHADGDGNSFTIRPAAMRPGDEKAVAKRLAEVLSSAGPSKPAPSLAEPAVELSGIWDVDVVYEVGSARHRLFLTVQGNKVTGFHEGWAYKGYLTGEVDGSRVRLHSSLPADGNQLSYTFEGIVSGLSMSGRLQMGEYGTAEWKAQRRQL